MKGCQYGSGRCIVAILSSDINSPTTGLTKCLKAGQIGDTKTNWGRKRRLKRTGCMEPRYNIFSKSWNCKYADGEEHY